MAQTAQKCADVRREMSDKLNKAIAYDNIPILAIEGTVSNNSANYVYLHEIALIDGTLSVGESSLSYSVLGNGYWMGDSRLVFLDKENEVTSYWASAVTKGFRKKPGCRYC